ncbi:MAG: hypothetical protein GF375_06995 [Candidatus Omnitrophica bacterium]|nr:hypothetical protein [Candidatus Omnitrophota bacterium]MBD3269723.1 hypothetical protein [Candidatus Omnitrophota bacterium]
MRFYILIYFFILFILFSSAVFAQQQGYKDPFEPLVLTDEAKEKKKTEGTTPEEEKAFLNSVNLEGVLWGGDDPQAIISGEVYRVGDKLKSIDAKVFKIEGNTVVISYGEKIYEMKPKKKKEEK